MSILSNSHRTATIAYIAPFLVYVSLMELGRATAFPAGITLPIRFLFVLLVLLVTSRTLVFRRPSFPVASLAVGIGVFLIWIAPDLQFHYRDHWLFQNRIFGSAVSSIAPELQRSGGFLAIRILSSTALVPVVEELFWRGWLMRWLIDPSFQKVPLGKYTPLAFWGVALLFASEHGPYWDVGLAAGIVYNWWLVRCRNLADCILAHAATNAALAVFVLLSGQWQYWL
ncbi:MAG TPA: CAAX prenyl protease-related protein [Bryobacteraceae bacterium]|nr:CAAX prenyl protease-related protein [Bryobacteraceae bacterium]